jgi:hypothetical protein
MQTGDLSNSGDIFLQNLMPSSGVLPDFPVNSNSKQSFN